MIKVGSDFSGVGAFEQSLIRLGIEHETVFSCDMDKYARQTYTLNFGEPKYYPENVYDRAIPSESLGIYMSSPPCQAFSLAGKRQGEADKRGILFYNTHEFIAKNKPRYFIIENVKGLLSDDSGRTFQRWLDMLGGKSINGKSIMFAHDESVPYHIHYQVLNAKHYGVPQNRERVFIVGIRDDADNNFRFPARVPLVKRLRDVLESEVDEKYFLSERLIDFFKTNTNTNKEKGNGFAFKPKSEIDTANAITTKSGSRIDDNYIAIPANTKQGYEIATSEDSINFSVPNSKTRRGGVGKGVAQTLDTACNQGVLEGAIIHNIHGGFGEDAPRVFHNYSPAIRTAAGGGHIPSTMQNSRIRRLTPTECLKLMSFNDDFIERTISSGLISDTQLYRQAGNSIVVDVLAGIIKNLKLQ